MDPRETIAHYEQIARHYATLIDEEPPPAIRRALERFAALARSPVLEIASGVGRDADWLERQGLTVRRTDATKEFAQIQAERGHTVEPLDVIADDLGGPYGGVLAMAMLMHVPRADIDAVLTKIAGALASHAPFLLCTREGEGGSPPPAAMTFYTRDEFAARLERAGLTIVWEDAFGHAGEDGESWLSFVAVRSGGGAAR